MGNLRKQIRQIINEIYSQEEISTGKLVQDLPFLANFELSSFNEESGRKTWKFKNDEEDNETNVVITQDGRNWEIDYDINGYLRDQVADFHLGPFHTYNDFLLDVGNHINNSLTVGADMNNDSLDGANEQLVKDLVDEIMAKRHEIYALPQGSLEDLKKLCTIIEKALETRKIEDIMDSLKFKNNKLTGVLNVLEKVRQLDHAKSMEKAGMNIVYPKK